MIKRNTWIVLIVLVVLAALVLFLQKTNLLSTPPLPSSTPLTMLLGNSNDPVTTIKLSGSQGVIIIASLQGDGTWFVSQPIGLQIRQAIIQEVLSDLSAISVQTTLLSQLPLETTGLQNPNHSITLTYKSGQEHVIKVGILTPVQNGYYVQLDVNTPVIVSQSNIDNIIELLSSVTYTPTPDITVTSEINTATPQVTPTQDMTITPQITTTP
jgi:hypothetical protein